MRSKCVSWVGVIRWACSIRSLCCGSLLLAAAGCAGGSHDASSHMPVRAEFSLDDPMFAPGPATRDGWGQWHLQNRVPVSTFNAGLDINVAPAWERGLTGRGVIVGVVDQAPQVNHPDLAPNYRADMSHDFSKESGGEIVRPSGAEHGTQCAGLSAARGGNGIGVSGVAPEAQWAALAAGTGMPVKQVAAATAWRMGELHILSQSLAYGPTMRVDEIQRATEQVYARGTIVVRAAGNTRGGFATDDCTAQSLASHPDAIVVAAVGSDGRFSSYSSYGAAVVCCALSDSQFDEAPPRRAGATTRAATPPASTGPARPSLGGVLTTHGPAGYARFGGTSAAAPIVAGTLALVRQARNDAGGLQGDPADWSRYIKHLLVRTCRVIMSRIIPKLVSRPRSPRTI